ncbi:MAG TPA: MBL fold metallo-hydrolase [Solirubrobacteraceae bacterium]
MTGPAPDTWQVDPLLAGARLCTPGLWRLRLPLSWPGISHVNAYAIARDDGLMLVDCGTAGHPSCAKALELALQQTGYRLEDVRLLAVTHAHSDHVGLAGWVFERSGCEVWMHPAARRFYEVIREPERIEAARGRRALQEGVPPQLLPIFADVSEELEAGGSPPAKIGELREGKRLPSALGEWEVLETPGHAPSQICLLQRERRTAIVGDTICSVFVPWFDYGLSNDPIGEFLASLDRIEALGELQLVLPGHGRPLSAIEDVLAGHRAGVAERLASTRRAVAQAGGGAFQVALEIFGEQRSDIAKVERLTEVAAYLRHLRLAGEVRREIGSDGRFRHLPAA